MTTVISDKKQRLIDIYRDTLAYSKQIITTPPPPSRKLRIPASLTVVHQHQIRYAKTNIIVEDTDVIDSIIRLHEKSPSSKINKMLVLNLASDRKYGGGAETGAMAQEEELFRKTDYGNHAGKDLYPLKMDEFVYTPCIYVVKDSEYRALPRENCVPFDGIAMAGIRNPVLENGRLNTKDRKITKYKIETIFKFAEANKNTNLVLGAIGCGVFKNPPEDIVEIYNECLRKYNGVFENIVFSVMSTEHNQRNYRIFNEGILRDF